MAGSSEGEFAAVSVSGETQVLGLFNKASGASVYDRVVAVGGGLGEPAPLAAPTGDMVYLESTDVCDSGLYRLAGRGGDAQPLIDPREAVQAFALNGTGSRIAVIRYAECGTQSAAIVVEYDAASGAEVRQWKLEGIERAVPTRIAWHPADRTVAIVRDSPSGTPDRVDLYELVNGQLTNPRLVTGLPACINGGLAHVRFAADALFIGQDCLDPETAAKRGYIHRVEIDGTKPAVTTVATTPIGTAIAGLDTTDDGTIVYTTVRWLEQDYEGPTTAYLISAGEKPRKLWESKDRLLGLAW